jgi:hypothetical protein
MAPISDDNLTLFDGSVRILEIETVESRPSAEPDSGTSALSA